jgi:AAA+ ATPase superfamily predicted ATPase
VIEFVGRDHELHALNWVLDRVREGIGGRAPGECVQLRGRRRIGKSSLVEEFLRRSKVPAVFYTAAQRGTDEELASFWESVVTSNLESRQLAADVRPTDWAGAFRTLAALLPDDRPSTIVIDELPYLIEQVTGFESILQRAWDTQLSRKPVLFILVGSDLAMMEALTQYDRPFHQRGREMVVGPLTPADIARLLDLPAAEAFDAFLVTGGLPLICQEWGRGASLWDYLDQAIANPVSALAVSAERSLAAEFPQAAQPRHVLSAIGSGERTFGNISNAAGGVAASSLARALEILVSKRIVAVDSPLSTRPSKERRYRVSDPYLRFWLSFIEPAQHLIDRRRSDLVLADIRKRWTSWRGRTIEPLLRESLARLVPVKGLPVAQAIGSYWTRTNDVEVDVVGADREPVARQILFVGSIKWLERAPFDAHDLVALQRHRAQLTTDPVPLLAISRSGVSAKGVDAEFGPEELIAAGRRPAAIFGP